MAVQNDMQKSYLANPYEVSAPRLKNGKPEVRYEKERDERLGEYASAVVESIRKIPVQNFIQYKELLKVELAGLDAKGPEITPQQKRTALLVIKRLVNEVIDTSDALRPSREELIAVIKNFENSRIIASFKNRN